MIYAVYGNGGSGIFLHFCWSIYRVSPTLCEEMYDWLKTHKIDPIKFKYQQKIKNIYISVPYHCKRYLNSTSSLSTVPCIKIKVLYVEFLLILITIT